MIIQIGTEVDESRILWKYKESDEWKRADIDDLIRAYENRPKGEWIDTDSQEFLKVEECSVCGHESIERGNFCRYCGADMRGEK